MIIWGGKGFLIAIIVAACLLSSDWFAGQHFHDPEYYATHGWPKLIGFFVAAAFVWLLSYKRKEEAIGNDVETPRESFFSDRDSLFFIPARFWPFILAGLGVVFYFVHDS